MRRDTPLMLALAALAVVLLLIAMVLWQRNVERTAEIEELRAELAAAQSDEPAEGGAETALPPTEPVEPADETVDGEWRFPIADRDYRRFTSPVGARISPITETWRDHQGVDIATVWRAEVVAAAAGEVVDHWPVGTYGGRDYAGHEVYGGYVEILHDNGWRTRYGHLDSTRVDLFRIGTRIAAGTALGRVGNTGQSVRDHLHFEMIDPNGARVNPLVYVDAGRER